MALKQMNNEMKSFINEATFIGERCRKKFLKLVDKHFFVELPKESFLHTDIILKENGNIVMREEEYETSCKVQKKEELEERYNNFKQEVEILLKKNEVDFDTSRRNKDVLNLFLVTIYTIIFAVVSIFVLRQILAGNIYSSIWFIFIIIYNFIPRVGEHLRNRYILAYRFLKRLFK